MRLTPCLWIQSISTRSTYSLYFFNSILPTLYTFYVPLFIGKYKGILVTILRIHLIGKYTYNIWWFIISLLRLWTEVSQLKALDGSSLSRRLLKSHLLNLEQGFYYFIPWTKSGPYNSSSSPLAFWREWTCQMYTRIWTSSALWTSFHLPNSNPV